MCAVRLCVYVAVLLVHRVEWFAYMFAALHRLLPLPLILQKQQSYLSEKRLMLDVETTQRLCW